MLVGSLRTCATCEHVIKRLVAAHCRIDAGGADRVNVNIVGGQFDGQRFDEAEYAVLGSDIMCEIRHAFDSCRGCNTDNFATALLEHLCNADLAGYSVTFELDVVGFI